MLCRRRNAISTSVDPVRPVPGPNSRGAAPPEGGLGTTLTNEGSVMTRELEGGDFARGRLLLGDPRWRVRARRSHRVARQPAAGIVRSAVR